METKKIHPEHAALIRDHITTIYVDDPYPEEVSYYARTPDCLHNERFEALRSGPLAKIFTVAQDSDKGSTYREVAAQLEKYFIVGYALSAVGSEIEHFPRRVGKCFETEGRWENGPFWGGYGTFCDMYEGHVPLVPAASFAVDEEVPKQDGLVTRAYTAYKEVFLRYYRYADADDTQIGAGEPPLVSPEDAFKEFREKLNWLHNQIKQVYTYQTAMILELCQP